MIRTGAPAVGTGPGVFPSPPPVHASGFTTRIGLNSPTGRRFHRMLYISSRSEVLFCAAQATKIPVRFKHFAQKDKRETNLLVCVILRTRVQYNIRRPLKTNSPDRARQRRHY